jgi:phenylalanyl-tRNA synthetase alpha subunit
MDRTDLPQRIVELLSRPNLTALPENPVGAIWEGFQRQYEGFTVVDLPEKLDPTEVRDVFGDAHGVEPHLDYASRQQWLRRELTIPMLVAARGRNAPLRVITTGKTYRIEEGEETETQLHAFHQAEALWIEEGISEWRIFDQLADFVESLQTDARLRIEQADFSPQCDRGWKVCVKWPGTEWSSIAGWGRIRSDVVTRLGFDTGQAERV